MRSGTHLLIRNFDQELYQKAMKFYYRQQCGVFKKIDLRELSEDKEKRGEYLIINEKLLNRIIDLHKELSKISIPELVHQYSISIEEQWELASLKGNVNLFVQIPLGSSPPLII